MRSVRGGEWSHDHRTTCNARHELCNLSSTAPPPPPPPLSPAAPEVIQSLPGQLGVADVEDFWALACYFSSLTPQSFRKVRIGYSNCHSYLNAYETFAPLWCEPYQLHSPSHPFNWTIPRRTTTLFSSVRPVDLSPPSLCHMPCAYPCPWERCWTACRIMLWAGSSTAWWTHGPSATLARGTFRVPCIWMPHWWV